MDSGTQETVPTRNGSVLDTFWKIIGGNVLDTFWKIIGANNFTKEETINLISFLRANTYTNHDSLNGFVDKIRYVEMTEPINHTNFIFGNHIPISNSHATFIASGASGKVYKSKKFDTIYKFINYDSAYDKFRIFKDVITEVYIQTILSCDAEYGNYIPKIKGVYHASNQSGFVIVMEFIPYSLNDYLQEECAKKSSYLEFSDIAPLLINITTVLEYFRAKYSFFHRDLHSGNIIFDSKWRPKIIDFGNATIKYNDYKLENGALFQSMKFTIENLENAKEFSCLCGGSPDSYSFDMVTFTFNLLQIRYRYLSTSTCNKIASLFSRDISNIKHSLYYKFSWMCNYKLQSIGHLCYPDRLETLDSYFKTYLNEIGDEEYREILRDAILPENSFSIDKTGQLIYAGSNTFMHDAITKGGDGNQPIENYNHTNLLKNIKILMTLDDTYIKNYNSSLEKRFRTLHCFYENGVNKLNVPPHVDVKSAGNSPFIINNIPRPMANVLISNNVSRANNIANNENLSKLNVLTPELEQHNIPRPVANVLISNNVSKANNVNLSKPNVLTPEIEQHRTPYLGLHIRSRLGKLPLVGNKMAKLGDWFVKHQRNPKDTKKQDGLVGPSYGGKKSRKNKRKRVTMKKYR